MKMKRVKYIYVAMLLLGTTSCADMLDRFPLDSLAPETYYNNEMELKSATNNFYGMFPGASSGYGESDDIVCVYFAGSDHRFTNDPYYRWRMGLGIFA